MIITGTGSALPEKAVSNDELRAFFDTNDEWIRTRTGIETRRVITHETLTGLAASAARSALEAAGKNASDIDAVIVSTLGGDLISPATACMLAGDLGIDTARVCDVNMGCCGFIYALDLADSMLLSGKAKRVLVAAAEAMTRNADWNDRSSAILFGDGAGAVIVEAGGKSDFHFTLKPSAENLFMGRHESISPFEIGETPPPYVKMNGQEIYRFAVESVWSGISALLTQNSLSPSDISSFILHQANMRIIKSLAQRSGEQTEKFPHNIERTGNTSSASVAILLDETARAGSLHSGDKIALSAFGSGLATASCLLEWQ